jgi:hypothetical protein
MGKRAGGVRDIRREVEGKKRGWPLDRPSHSFPSNLPTSRSIFLHQTRSAVWTENSLDELSSHQQQPRPRLRAELVSSYITFSSVCLFYYLPSIFLVSAKSHQYQYPALAMLEGSRRATLVYVVDSGTSTT